MHRERVRRVRLACLAAARAREIAIDCYRPALSIHHDVEQHWIVVERCRDDVMCLHEVDLGCRRLLRRQRQRGAGDDRGYEPRLADVRRTIRISLVTQMFSRWQEINSDVT